MIPLSLLRFPPMLRGKRRFAAHSVHVRGIPRLGLTQLGPDRFRRAVARVHIQRGREIALLSIDVNQDVPVRVGSGGDVNAVGSGLGVEAGAPGGCGEEGYKVVEFGEPRLVVIVVIVVG